MNDFAKIASILTSRPRCRAQTHTKQPYCMPHKDDVYVVATDGHLLFLCKQKGSEIVCPPADSKTQKSFITMINADYPFPRTIETTWADLVRWVDSGSYTTDVAPGFIHDVLIDKSKLEELLHFLSPCDITITHYKDITRKVTFEAPDWTIILAPMHQPSYTKTELKRFSRFGV